MAKIISPSELANMVQGGGGLPNRPLPPETYTEPIEQDPSYAQTPTINEWFKMKPEDDPGDDGPGDDLEEQPALGMVQRRPTRLLRDAQGRRLRPSQPVQEPGPTVEVKSTEGLPSMEYIDLTSGKAHLAVGDIAIPQEDLELIKKLCYKSLVTQLKQQAAAVSEMFIPRRNLPKRRRRRKVVPAPPGDSSAVGG